MKFKKWILLMIAALAVLQAQSCQCSRDRGGTKGLKTYYYRNEGLAKTMDPQAQFDAYSSAVAALNFDALYMYHYLKRPYELVPNLAAAMPEYSADGKVMTIKLRDDVTFHDDQCFEGGKGRKFVANDVVYTLKRFGDARVNTQGSVTLVEGLIEGFDDFMKLTKSPEAANLKINEVQVSGIQALDDHTVQIRLLKPSPVVFYVLGNHITSIVPRECAEYYGEDFGFHPVGTGPFLISYKNRKGDLVLKKYPRYHLRYPSEGEPGDAEKGLLADAGKQLPLVDEVVLPVIQEAQPAMLKFMRGYLDWVRIDSDSFSNIAEKSADGTFKLKPDYASKYQLYPAEDLAAYWWVFNLKDPVLGKNVKLRKALAHAINRQGYVDDIFNGRGVVIDTVVPSTIAGNAKDTGQTWYPYDVEAARKLLAEAGYPGGKGLPTLKMMYASSPSIQRQYEYLRRSWAEIGVKLELETLPYTAYIKKFAEGGFQVSIAGWGADYLDAENFLMLFTKSALDNELFYGGSWTHPEYEKMIQQIREIPNGPERLAIIKRMTDLIKEDVPVIPTFTYNRIGLNAPWLKNWKRNMGDDREAVYVDIDEAAREKGYAP